MNLATRISAPFVAAFLALSPASVAVAETWPLAVPSSDQTAPTALPPRPLPDFNQPLDVIAAFDASLALYEHFQLQLPSEAERVLSLDIDPEQAFALIRDQVQSLRYDGHLRDPAAVFAARSGNAYDKALALSDLLARMGYDARLVAGSAASPDPGDPACGTGSADPQTWALTKLGTEVLERVPLRAAASFAGLRPHLTPMAQDLPPSTDLHIWVQMRDGADWINLDPWTTTTAYGDAPAGAGTPLTTPPQTHSVTLELIIETLADGELRRDTILNAELDVPTATTAMISLGFGPEIEGIAGGIAAALGALDGSAQNMVANLMINGDARSSRPFAAPGNPVQAGEAFLSDGPPTDVTTALFLTVTSRVPGLPDHAETRSIIDLIPPVARGTPDIVIDPAALLPVTMGGRYPAALESLRLFVISNGGLSQRLMAAVGVRQMLDLPDLMQRANDGAVDGWDMLWGAWIQASRIELASETLLSARPAHLGSCAVIDRPRVLIWGLAGAGGDKVLQWLDWTIDDYGVVGGNAQAQAEARLWHGALQGALEKEAVMQIALAPDDLMPLDSGPMAALSAAQLASVGAEAARDMERGYMTLADAGTPDGVWWRLNPATGAADVRALMHGNVGFLEWGQESASLARGGAARISTISEAEQAYLGSRTNAQLLAEIERDMQAARAAAAKPSCGGNEYMILQSCVSIPVSLVAGAAIGGAIAYVMLR